MECQATASWASPLPQNVSAFLKHLSLPREPVHKIVFRDSLDSGSHSCSAQADTHDVYFIAELNSHHLLSPCTNQRISSFVRFVRIVHDLESETELRSGRGKSELGDEALLTASAVVCPQNMH